MPQIHTKFDMVGEVEEIPPQEMPMDKESWRRAQKSDQLLGAIWRYVEDGKHPGHMPTCWWVVKNTTRFQIIDGLLQWTEPVMKGGVKTTLTSIAVPDSLQKQVMKYYHEETSHLGIRKVYTRLREQFWWRGMYTALENFIAGCVNCQVNKPSTDEKVQLQKPIEAKRWLQVVAADCLSLPRIGKEETDVLVTQQGLRG
jgi:hypothetical protein